MYALLARCRPISLAIGLLFGLPAPLSFAIVPTTFSTEIGHALLCLNELDAGYFYQYLNTAFGKPYKHEQGAHFFKVGSTLWGVPVSEVMVSDGLGQLTFIGAIVDVPPEQADSAIAATMGIHHSKIETGKYPLREAPAGSMLVYFKTKAKIYCAKSQYLRPLKE